MDDLIVINRSIQEVFAYVTNHANDKFWKPFVTESRQVSTGAIGVGTLFEIVTTTWKQRSTGQVEILEYKPYSWYVYKSNSQPFHFVAQLLFSPTPSGTQLQGQVTFHAKGLWKLFTPFLAIFFHSQTKQTFTRLKQVMESPERKTT
jgi:hypothetical protein